MAPALVFFAVWMLLFRRFPDKQGFGDFLQVAKSKAKVYMEKETGVSFADVAGVDEAKAELEEVVDFLKAPETYGMLGARIEVCSSSSKKALSKETRRVSAIRSELKALSSLPNWRAMIAAARQAPYTLSRTSVRPVGRVARLRP